MDPRINNEFATAAFRFFPLTDTRIRQKQFQDIYVSYFISQVRAQYDAKGGTKER